MGRERKKKIDGGALLIFFRLESYTKEECCLLRATREIQVFIWLILIATVFQPWNRQQKGPALVCFPVCVSVSVSCTHTAREAMTTSFIQLRIPAACLSFERVETRRSGVSRLLSHLYNFGKRPNVTLFVREKTLNKKVALSSRVSILCR